MPIEIRRALPTDALAVAEMHVESWRAAYGGIIPSNHLAELDVVDRASRYTFDSQKSGDPVTWLGIVDGAIAGFVTISPCRDDDLPGYGEVQAIYLSPASFGTGLGGLLLRHGESELIGLGFTDAALWVFCDNERARNFYAAKGWTCDGLVKEFSMREVPYRETRYRKHIT